MGLTPFQAITSANDSAEKLEEIGTVK